MPGFGTTGGLASASWGGGKHSVELTGNTGSVDLEDERTKIPAFPPVMTSPV